MANSISSTPYRCLRLARSFTCRGDSSHNALSSSLFRSIQVLVGTIWASGYMTKRPSSAKRAMKFALSISRVVCWVLSSCANLPQ